MTYPTAQPRSPKAPPRSGLLPLLSALCLLLVLAAPAWAAPSASQLEKDLGKEQERATARRAGLKRLTEQERRVIVATAAQQIAALQDAYERATMQEVAR